MEVSKAVRVVVSEEVSLTEDLVVSVAEISNSEMIKVG
jgi:hypothetical protein